MKESFGNCANKNKEGFGNCSRPSNSYESFANYGDSEEYQVEHFGFGDIFNFGKKDDKKVINAMESKGNPPNLSTLEYGASADSDGEGFDKEVDKTMLMDAGLSESELAINSKITQANLPKLPNYSKNPELELKDTVNQLKGGGNLGQFRKGIDIPVQKQQPNLVMKGSLPNNLPPGAVISGLPDELAEVTQMGGNMAPPPPPPGAPMGQVAPMGMSMGGMKCKFLNSSKCHPNYPNYSGASLSFPGAKMKCDSAGLEELPKAVCSISGGKISGVYIIKSGSGLSAIPKIDAVGGGGEGASLKGVVVNGKLTDIKIISGGKGYHETPQIKIESPQMSESCYLCCQ